MVARVQRSSSGRPAQKAGVRRVPVRRRRPCPAYGRIALLSGLLAGAFLAVSSTTVAYQDVASLFGRDLPVSQRWLAKLVPTPSGEAYVPTLVAGEAASTGLIVKPVLDFASTGTISAPEFIPPRINRDDKRDAEMSRPQPVAPSKFAAGVLQSENLSPVFGAAAAAPQMAFLLPKDVDKPVARPSVAMASLAPLPLRGRAKAHDASGSQLRKPETVLSAYANPDPAEAIEAPFKAVLNQPMAIGKDGKPDHWWVTNPIPPNARSATEQKCMATAIYFEARGEPVKGELAVAQVVINRLKNPAYPGTICGVVYQNKDMRNACQFSFACDGIPDRITDASAWTRAQEIARRVLYRQDWWNADIGSSTHYHANYVRPRWARTMKKMEKIGHHIFYKTYGGGWS